MRATSVSACRYIRRYVCRSTHRWVRKILFCPFSFNCPHACAAPSCLVLSIRIHYCSCPSIRDKHEAIVYPVLLTASPLFTLSPHPKLFTPESVSPPFFCPMKILSITRPWVRRSRRSSRVTFPSSDAMKCDAPSCVIPSFLTLSCVIPTFLAFFWVALCCVTRFRVVLCRVFSALALCQFCTILCCIRRTCYIQKPHYCAKWESLEKIVIE